jgi:Pro-kumamolisin, activation domain/Viral BACON domain/Subtilase family
MKLIFGTKFAIMTPVNLYRGMKFQKIFFAAGLAAVFLSGMICFPAAAQTVRQTFHLHVLDEAAHLQPVGQPLASKQLNLAISLPLRNRAALDELIRQIYDPTSTNYHRYLTPQQFTERFGPTDADYQKVIAFARANNLTVTAQHPNRAVLDVAGSVANIEKTFHVALRTYQHPKERRTFFAPDAEPSVDLMVPILHISGLDDFALPHPANLLENASEITPNGTGSIGGAFAGNDFRAAYVPGTVLTGAGQTVALLQFDGYYSNDITAYESQAGLPAVTLTNVAIDGGVNTPGSGVAEVSLDIEMVISMAPGVSQIVVYEAPNPSPWVDLLSRIANDNLAKQISCSWGGGAPDAGSEQAFVQMAVQGQSFFNASGDSDAFTGAIGFPAESTNITQVGGTTLTTAGPGGAYVSETVWNWGLHNGSYLGSSGGISPTYPIPNYQQGISMAANQGSTTRRNIPDVALTGDNVYVIYNNGSAAIFGGTSCAAPLWAGFIALVNQQAAAAGSQPVGFLNPAIYEIGRESTYAANFHDIITGNNFWPSSPASFSAVPGYDLCTGWGTPSGTNLINALVSPDPFIIVPAAGFNSSGPYGGPFSITNQSFSVSNSGPASLDWSVISTSSWLNVSSTGGTLPPGVSDSLTVNLNSIAASLPVGTYNGNFWLTNLTSEIGHSRLFTLQVNDPVVISPTNGFVSTGPPGGPFTVKSQNFSLTNLGAASIDWLFTNLPDWLTASSASGTLPPFGSSSVTIGLNSAAANLPVGFYTTNISFMEVTDGFAKTLQFSLSVLIVQNGGFETGDFTSWSRSGNLSFTYVSTATDFVHSGTYGAQLGPSGALGFLSQTLPTVAGQSYLVSAWLDSPDGGTPNNFVVSWNGATIFSQTNLSKIGWTNLQFIVTATNSSSVLKFGFRDDPNYLGLDDVSVVPFSLPVFSTTVQTNNTLIFNWNTTTGLTYQVQYKTNLSQSNWLNLGSAITATNTSLTVPTNSVLIDPQRFYRLQVHP